MTDAQQAFGGPGPRASRAGYWLGGALLVAAVVGAIAWLVLGFVRLDDAVDELARVPIPGERVVTLSEGRKSIYFEGPGGSDADVPPIEIVVLPATGGGPLAIEDHSGRVTYSFGGHAGVSVAGVDVPRDGQYSVRVAATIPAELAELAIGRGLGNRIVIAIVGAIAIFLAGGAAGTVVLARTSRRRRQAPGGSPS